LKNVVIVAETGWKAKKKNGREKKQQKKMLASKTMQAKSSMM
jgi:hypothetical protein